MLLVDFINVGYGDAILIRDMDAPFTMLVDCGDVHIGASRPDGRRTTAADYLQGEGIRTLDLLVLTHLHLDHAGGLAHLLPGIRPFQQLCDIPGILREAFAKKLAGDRG